MEVTIAGGAMMANWRQATCVDIVNSWPRSKALDQEQQHHAIPVPRKAESAKCSLVAKVVHRVADDMVQLLVNCKSCYAR